MAKLFWEGWTDSIIEGYAELVLQPIFCVIIVVLLGIYVYVFVFKRALCVNNGNNDSKMTNKEMISDKIPKKYKYLLLISLVITGINIFGNTWLSNQCILIYNIRYKNHCFYRVLLGTTLILQRMLCYYFFIDRLRNIFVGSIFEIRKKCFYICVISGFIISIGIYIINIVFAYIHESFLCSNNNALRNSIIISFIVDLITSILLTSVFIIKLRSLINLTNINDAKVNQTNLKLRFVATKFTILCLVSVTSTIIFSIILANVITVISYQNYSMDVIINNACMMLSFGIMNDQYQRICCICITIQHKCTSKHNLDIQLQSYISSENEVNSQETSRNTVDIVTSS